VIYSQSDVDTLHRATPAVGLDLLIDAESGFVGMYVLATGSPPTSGINASSRIRLVELSSRLGRLQ
jgi:hypothetical protein